MRTIILLLTLFTCTMLYGQDNNRDVEIKLEDTVVDLRQGITQTSVQGTLNVMVKPTDAYTYRIGEMEVILSDDSRRAKQQLKVSSETASLSTFTSLAKSGDILVVKVNRLYIANKDGVEERTSTRGMIYTIPIH